MICVYIYIYIYIYILGSFFSHGRYRILSSDAQLNKCLHLLVLTKNKLINGMLIIILLIMLLRRCRPRQLAANARQRES